MAKIKVTLTYYTNDLNPEYYPIESRTPESMYEIDKEYYDNLGNLIESLEFCDDSSRFSIETELIK